MPLVTVDKSGAFQANAALSAEARLAHTNQNPQEKKEADPVGGTVADAKAELKNFFDGLSPAPLKQRIVAAIIDHGGLCLFLIVLICLALLPMSHWIANGVADYNPFDADKTQIIYIATFTFLILPYAVPLFYFAWYESSGSQATPGKRLMGLRVIGLDGRKIDYDRALAKSITQYIILAILSTIVAIAVAIPFGLLSLDKVVADPVVQIFVFILESIAAMIFMCLPILKSRKQTLLDAMLGRMVIKTSDFDEEAWSKLAVHQIKKKKKSITKIVFSICYWVAVIAVEIIWLLCISPYTFSKFYWVLPLLPVIPPLFWHLAGERKWRWMRMGSLIISMLTLGACLALLVPYNITFLEKTLQAMPIAEEGFKRDPTGDSIEARRYLDQANKTFRELPTSYFIGGTIANVLGQTKLKDTLHYRCVALQPRTVTSLTVRAQSLENSKQYDRALLLYRQALSTKLRSTEDLTKEYSELRHGAAPKPDFFGRLPEDPQENYADARSGEARMLVNLKRYPEATAALSQAIDFYLRESFRIPEKFNNEKLKTSMSSLYASRAQAWRALNKPNLAKEDDRMSKGWQGLNLGPDHFSVTAPATDDPASQ